MELETAAKIIGLIAAATAAWQALDRRTRRKRFLENLSAEIELYSRVPDDWPEKEKVKGYLQRQMVNGFDEKQLARQERQLNAAVGALITVALFVSTVVLLVNGSGWALLTGIMFVSAIKGHYDEDKRTVVDKKDTGS